MQNDQPILIVDDSTIMRQTVKGILGAMGYTEIHLATNGMEALEKVNERLAPGGPPMFKVIFLDRNMPEMDGIVFLKKLRTELMVKDTAVIMLTAFSDQDSIIAALECGATSYIIKPASPEMIEKKMLLATNWLEEQKKTP